jgi:PPOX class probable F420-dependent enzyme
MRALERARRLSDRLFDRLRHKRAFAVNEQSAVEGNLESLRRHKYAVLVTFRGNGDAVPSPVWFGVDQGGKAYLHTARNSGKVKRLRLDRRVVIVPSNARGKPRGPALKGVGRVLPKEEWPHAEETVAAAYGLGRRIFQRALEGSEDPGVYIEITSRDAGMGGQCGGERP